MKNKTPKTILTQKGFEKLISGHPWVHSKDIKNLNELPSQTGVLHFGEHWFFHSPMSRLRLRRLGPAERNWLKPPEDQEPFIDSIEKFESTFFKEIYNHFKTRLELKKSLLIEPNEDLCLRWIFSESDLAPGLIVDIFRDQLVCQILTAPVELFWPVFEKILNNVFKEITGKQPNLILNKSSNIRLKEGLKVSENETSTGDWFFWNGLNWWMNPGSSQKTGAYFDQRENHTATLEWALKLGYNNAWDLCCYEGGFGLHLAKANLNVMAVDQSSSALEAATKNAKKNEILKFQTQCSDIFTFLRSQYDKNNKTDLIVLDPPSFVKSKEDLHSAMKGYKELNLRAMHSLNSNGLLVSCSCSQNVSRDSYLEMLQSAAHDTRKTIRILEVKGPSLDHAPLLGFKESNYLQTWYLLVE